MALAMPARPAPRAVLLSRREWIFVSVLLGAILLTTGFAFLLLFVIAGLYDAPATTTQPAIVFWGLGILSFFFGLRHGVDADHIVAIDNTTRKLLYQNKRPLTVGTWFSLGHSTIVVGMVVGLVFAARFVVTQAPEFQTIGGIVGTLVSGTFLWLIGIINLIIVLEIYRIFQQLKRGQLNESQLEEQLGKRGFMNRYFGRLFRVVETPRQMYPVGVLFGLGFDTASEILLIAISVTIGVSTSIPLYVVLILPLLFTCGMVLVDTLDGLAMRLAYGWAFLKPMRKIYYNLTITIISVLVAFVIGGVEFLSVLGQELGYTGPFWDTIGSLSLTYLGFAIVAIFLVCWLVSVVNYRLKRYDEVGFDTGKTPGVLSG